MKCNTVIPKKATFVRFLIIIYRSNSSVTSRKWKHKYVLRSAYNK